LEWKQEKEADQYAKHKDFLKNELLKVTNDQQKKREYITFDFTLNARLKREFERMGYTFEYASLPRGEGDYWRMKW
jgi:hypothetical protein